MCKRLSLVLFLTALLGAVLFYYLDFKGIDRIAESVMGSSGLTLESVYVPLRARPDLPDGESWHRVSGRDFRDLDNLRQWKESLLLAVGVMAIVNHAQDKASELL